MSKKKYITLSVITMIVACLLVIFHIPFFTLVLGGEKVFELRGTFLIISPIIIITVSVLATVIINILTKKYNLAKLKNKKIVNIEQCNNIPQEAQKSADELNSTKSDKKLNNINKK